jgi:hypothetical protein
MQEIEQTYEIRRNGFYRHTHSWEYIGEETEMVRHLQKRVPIALPNLTSGKHLCVSQTGLSLASRITMLQLHTYFAPMTGTDEKVVMVPVFLKGTNRAADMSMDWTVPETMRLYFVSRWAFAAGIEGAVGVMPLFYLIAVDPSQKRTHILPLPNIYDEGKVCMGSGTDMEKFDLRQDVFQQQDYALNAFLKSRWNADLLNENRAKNSKLIFRFDSKGKCLPPEVAWTAICPVVNHDAYSFLVKMP